MDVALNPHCLYVFLRDPRTRNAAARMSSVLHFAVSTILIQNSICCHHTGRALQWIPEEQDGVAYNNDQLFAILDLVNSVAVVGRYWLERRLTLLLSVR